MQMFEGKNMLDFPDYLRAYKSSISDEITDTSTYVMRELMECMMSIYGSITDQSIEDVDVLRKKVEDEISKSNSMILRLIEKTMKTDVGFAIQRTANSDAEEGGIDSNEVLFAGYRTSAPDDLSICWKVVPLDLEAYLNNPNYLVDIGVVVPRYRNPDSVWLLLNTGLGVSGFEIARASDENLFFYDLCRRTYRAKWNGQE